MNARQWVTLTAGIAQAAVLLRFPPLRDLLAFKGEFDGEAVYLSDTILDIPRLCLLLTVTCLTTAIAVFLLGRRRPSLAFLWSRAIRAGALRRSLLVITRGILEVARWFAVGVATIVFFFFVLLLLFLPILFV